MSNNIVLMSKSINNEILTKSTAILFVFIEKRIPPNIFSLHHIYIYKQDFHKSCGSTIVEGVKVPIHAALFPVSILFISTYPLSPILNTFHS